MFKGPTDWNIYLLIFDLLHYLRCLSKLCYHILHVIFEDVLIFLAYVVIGYLIYRSVYNFLFHICY